MSLIKYRYPNEDWQTIEGDNYTINEVGGQCYTGYDVYFQVIVRWYRVAFRDSRGYIAEYRDYPKQVKMSTFSNMRVANSPFPKLGSTQYPQIKYSNGTTEVLTTDWKITGTIQMIGQYPGGGTVTFQTISSDKSTPKGSGNFLAGSLADVRYAAKVSEPPDCAVGCEFRVYLEDEIVFQSTRKVCPEIENSSQCPENTCEVICGDTTCCYNSQGIAVESFPIS